MKRRYIRIVIAGIIFLLALLLTLYPVISNLYILMILLQL